MKKKIDEGRLTSADIPTYLRYMVGLCNTSDYIQEELEGVRRLFQFIITRRDDSKFWLKLSNGAFGTDEGVAIGPDVTLEIDNSAGRAVDIFTGKWDFDDAWRGGFLRLVGPLYVDNLQTILQELRLLFLAVLEVLHNL